MDVGFTEAVTRISHEIGSISEKLFIAAHLELISKNRVEQYK